MGKVPIFASSQASGEEHQLENDRRKKRLEGPHIVRSGDKNSLMKKEKKSNVVPLTWPLRGPVGCPIVLLSNKPLIVLVAQKEKGQVKVGEIGGVVRATHLMSKTGGGKQGQKRGILLSIEQAGERKTIIWAVASPNRR